MYTFLKYLQSYVVVAIVISMYWYYYCSGISRWTWPAAASTEAIHPTDGRVIVWWWVVVHAFNLSILLGVGSVCVLFPITPFHEIHANPSIHHRTTTELSNWMSGFHKFGIHCVSWWGWSDCGDDRADITSPGDLFVAFSSSSNSDKVIVLNKIECVL